MAEKKGPRSIYFVGKGKNGKAIYSYMLRSTGDHFGFTPEKKIPQSKGKNGRIVTKRGSTSGANAITVPMGPQFKTKKGSPKTRQIPLPNGMTIPKTQEFLKKAKKNRPLFFTTSDGITYPVE
ncbi:MAG: hypothetical protein RH949_13300 [Coleofasciculus sp. A1-SPW-01]|uniref:hypothetical protein n=1 Tax=Coleofasciculus sp. A1-SPW-01 TaxID=3070819 RepID=UPI0032F23B12